MSATFPSPTWLLIAAVLAGVTACSGGPGEASPPDSVASVIVDPPYGRIEPGETVQLGASPRAENGEELSGRTVTWKSLAASIATVTTSGLVLAVAPGSAVITASAEGSQGAALITILGPVGSVTILNSWPATLLPGESVAWQAEVRDTGANILRRATVGWSSSDTAVATVDALGHVAGVAAGTAVIAATAGAIADKAGITVNPLSDLRGAWSMTEAGGCVANGPITLTQDLSLLVGTYQQSGTCRLVSGRSIDRTGTHQVNGRTAGSEVHFQTSGAVFCTYRGTIEGDPASRIQGSMECRDAADDDQVVATGTFMMTR
jgi:hypothetical protein